MISLLLSPKAWAGFAVGAVLVAPVAYWQGRAAGAAQSASRQLEQVITENRDWNNAQNRAQRLAAYDACLAVSRVHDDCKELLQPSAAAEGQ